MSGVIYWNFFAFFGLSIFKVGLLLPIGRENRIKNLLFVLFTSWYKMDLLLSQSNDKNKWMVNLFGPLSGHLFALVSGKLALRSTVGLGFRHRVERTARLDRTSPIASGYRDERFNYFEFVPQMLNIFITLRTILSV